MRILVVAVITLVVPCAVAHASTQSRSPTATTSTQVDRGSDDRSNDEAADTGHHRNYFANAVAFVLAVIAVVLLVRRRRRVFNQRR